MLQLTNRRSSSFLKLLKLVPLFKPVYLTVSKEKKAPEKGGKLRGLKLVERVTMFTGKLFLIMLG
jgi:hypothetical protein